MSQDKAFYEILCKKSSLLAISRQLTFDFEIISFLMNGALPPHIVLDQW